MFDTAKKAKITGDKYYFTGKPCKNGHIVKRLASTNVCIECNHERYLNDRENVINKGKNRRDCLKEQNPNYEKEKYAKNRETQKSYRLKNKDIRSAQSKEWYLKNHSHALEYAKKYSLNVPVMKKRAQARKNYINNKSTFIANVAKSRAAKLKRTPPWLSESDKRELRLIYKIAARVSKETGIKYHVDHKIPLQGEFVSGLHVPDNLQLLKASENLLKSNNFIPEDL